MYSITYFFVHFALRPSREKEPIWSRSFTTDEYLHNPNLCKPYTAGM